MLDAIYSPAGADLNILASVSDAFDHVRKVQKVPEFEIPPLHADSPDSASADVT